MAAAHVARVVALLLLWCGRPLAARADDTGISKVVPYVIAGAIGAAFDVGFTIHDAIEVGSGSRGPTSLGWIETVGALPQVVIAGYVFANPPPADSVRALALVWAGWASLLAAHGIWTIARPPAADAEPAPSAMLHEPLYRDVGSAGTGSWTPRIGSSWSVAWRF
jgi:hypothetical protein